MNKQQIIANTADFIKTKFTGEGSGHDWLHIDRVWKTAKKIAAQEHVDTFVVEMAALLHDIADYKFHEGDELAGGRAAREWLQSQNVDVQNIEAIVHIVDNISFKGQAGSTKIKSKEGLVTQDADRLDSMGAIGIARCFAYGGFKGQPIYDPALPPRTNMSKEDYKAGKTTGINHFYEKLFLLKDLMNTETGKELAQQRHEFMQQFINMLLQEIA